jgi:antitoxin component of RelBE/YafQ-DinJ toxin-antitoxin module
LGLSLSGAVNIFVRQAVRQRGLPFMVTAEPDPLYNRQTCAGWKNQSRR